MIEFDNWSKFKKVEHIKLAVLAMMCIVLFFMNRVPTGKRISSNEDLPNIVDNANLFSRGEISKLEKHISKLEKSYKYDIVLITDSRDITDENSYYYGLDYVSQSGYGYEEPYGKALLLYINTNTRYVYNWCFGDNYSLYFNNDTMSKVNHIVYSGNFSTKAIMKSLKTMASNTTHIGVSKDRQKVIVVATVFFGIFILAFYTISYVKQIRRIKGADPTLDNYIVSVQKRYKTLTLKHVLGK